NITQLTKGNWQVEWAKWNERGNDIVYLSTQDGASERTFSSLSVAKDDNEYAFAPDILRSSERFAEHSMKTNPQMERGSLLFTVSRWNSPDELYATARLNGPGPGTHYTNKLTNTIPNAFSNEKWSEPKFIDIPSRDGKQIKSKIYVPTGFDHKKKYPMVIFV